MIAYRVEIWCDGATCSEHFHDSIPHNDPREMPGLSRNLLDILKAEGKWAVDGNAHFCPKCQRQRQPAGNATGNKNRESK